MTDLHIHTVYCDGEDKPEDIVKEAIGMGMKRIGFSAHSYTDFDKSYCMEKEDYDAYKSEINFLKEKYSSKIKILCGIEQDLYSDMPYDDFDYVIGSVHYIKCNSEYISVDETEEILLSAAQKYFGGDMLALAEEYFAAVSELPNDISIIGHFDLISKFNENNRLFSETDERYITSCRKAIDRLTALNIPFEVNTGAVSRGYRSSAYPSRKQLEYIKEKGGTVILSSDSHTKKTLCFGFDKERERLSRLGFKI